MINDYLSLSSREGFNKSLGHFRLVTGIVKRIGGGENLADIIDSLEREKNVSKAQIGPILNAVITDRMKYQTLSLNLPSDVQEFEKVVDETEKWNRLDLILAYHHPQLGVSLINPKHKGQWESIRELDQNELLVIYAGAFVDEDKKFEGPALETLKKLILGKKISNSNRFGGAAPRPEPVKEAPKAAPVPAAKAAPPVPGVRVPAAVQPGMKPPTAAAAAPKGGAAEKAPEEAPGAGGKARMTPKYSVQVTNELFHNGNVEAWKNIVESYKAKYKGLEVHIFHDGQKVNNINSLFKWGKVKHGDVILFSVAGEEIKGVAKLQRYLFEGASQRFEKFLKKDVNKVLTLF
ncbi:MAG: hypothetical protein OEZ59_08470 [Deltaproteobacteria bacterium]|nr:hypothetical protein [Deltaproteobacteria bacterium]